MNISNAKLEVLTLHHIGNKSDDALFFTSANTVPLSDELKERLTLFYLQKFTAAQDRYRFWHADELKYNEVYNYAATIFSDKTQFGKTSSAIARHLYEHTEHPGIKPGELHVVLFSGITYAEQAVDVIGIFKTENKAGFFEVSDDASQLSLLYKEGIDVNKIDKACLIIDTAAAEGFELCVIDNQNKKDTTKYWMDDFLSVIQVSNEYSQTNELLNLTKKYITQQFADDFEVAKTDQIDLLNRSIDYFKNHDQFDKDDFEQTVFYHPETIQSFRRFDEQYRQQNELDIEDNFEISMNAVKKQARIFKSVLKLDRNFHIYIHGNKEMIEKGVDENGRKFYKIFYEQES
jgi:hypothetical protein